MYEQAGLSLCWSHIPHCWKSHVTAQPHCWKSHVTAHILRGRYRGGPGGLLEPPSPPTFQISYENEIIWSQRDQIISFSWDIEETQDKISKANPHTVIHTNPLSRNPGSAPDMYDCSFQSIWSLFEFHYH